MKTVNTDDQMREYIVDKLGVKAEDINLTLRNIIDSNKLQYEYYESISFDNSAICRIGCSVYAYQLGRTGDIRHIQYLESAGYGMCVLRYSSCYKRGKEGENDKTVIEHETNLNNSGGSRPLSPFLCSVIVACQRCKCWQQYHFKASALCRWGT